MGSKRLDSLADYHRHGYSLRLDCLTCKRVVIKNPLPILQLCRERGWSKDMAFVTARLRCGECGSREVRVGPGFGHQA